MFYYYCSIVAGDNNNPQKSKYLVNLDTINFTAFNRKKTISQEQSKLKVTVTPDKSFLLFYILIDDSYNLVYGFTDGSVSVGTKNGIILFYRQYKPGRKINLRWLVSFGKTPEDCFYFRHSYYFDIGTAKVFNKSVPMKNVQIMTLNKGYFMGNSIITDEAVNASDMSKRLDKLSRDIYVKYVKGPQYGSRKHRIYAENETNLIRFLNATCSKESDGPILGPGQYITRKGMSAKAYEEQILRNNPKTAAKIRGLRTQKDILDTITLSELDQMIAQAQPKRKINEYDSDEEPLNIKKARLLKDMFSKNQVSYFDINGNILPFDLNKPIQPKVNSFMLYYSSKEKCFGIRYNEARNVKDRTSKNKKASGKAPKYYLKSRFYLKVLDPSARFYNIQFYDSNKGLLGTFNYNIADKISKKNKIFRVKD